MLNCYTVSPVLQSWEAPDVELWEAPDVELLHS